MKYVYAQVVLALFVFSFSAKGQYRTLEFIENKGQWEGPFAYQASTDKEVVFLQKTGFTYTVSDKKNVEHAHKLKEGILEDGAVFKYHTYRLHFVGANENVVITPSKKENHYYNYFLGNNPSKWKSGIHPARVLDYQELYPGIDLHLSSENQSLKYEFIVAAGADAGQIQLKYEGQEKLSVKNGNLIIHTSVGEVKELKPYTYQLINGEKKEIPCAYKIQNGETVTYTFPKGYDKSSLMVIDPTVVFATFTGASADNWGYTATYDDSGSFYAGGIVHYIVPSNTFPTSVGAFQSIYNGGNAANGYECDMVLFKYNATGSAYLYATFLGGSDNEQPHSLIVDSAGNLIVAGRSYSSNFPTTLGAYDQSHNGQADIVVSKLNANGTQLLGSTFLGGSGNEGVNENASPFVAGTLKHNFGDDARSEVIIDNAGDIYIAASTTSTNFPTQNAYQSSLQGGQDGIITKFNSSLSNILWSTYLGGNANDAAYVLALNRQQSHVYVAGGTMSSNFPTTSGTLYPSYQGGTVDGFIARFNNSGAYGLDRMTFIGANGYDQCYGLQIDAENSVYAMGQTLGGGFPVSPGVFTNPNSSQFIIKLDSLLTTRVYSTVFGSGNSTATNISPVAFLVDTCQNVYISGWGGNPAGGSTNFFPGTGTTTGMPLSSSPAQSTTDGNDFYFIVLEKNIQNLLYATYMGGTGSQEHVDGGTSRFDKSGVVYQAICGGCGGSSNFPTTPGSVSTINGSQNCNLVAVKIAFELGAVDATAAANPDTTGCAPFTVTFGNGSINAVTYQWAFGDGGTSTQATPTHTYLSPGTYNVRLIATNPNACKPIDTAYVTIVVDSTSLHPAFTAAIVDSCGPYTANFANTSTTGASGTTTYFWDFGDGTTSVLQNPPLHTFPDTGCYDVRLIMTNPNACNSPDTVMQQICYLKTGMTAGFNLPDSICLGEAIQATNTTVNGQTYSWTFGDGNTSTATNPAHTYTSPGMFTVQLIATNPQACNIKDTFAKQVFVSNNTIAAGFRVNKVDSCGPFTANFDNTSQFGTTPGAQNFTRFFWDFDDGTTYQGQNPPFHVFPDSGCYTIRLIMVDTTACNSPDTLSQTICYNPLFMSAQFIAPDTICVNAGVLFANQSLNATASFWDFGDGNTSNATSPVHTFSQPGLYTVRLISSNPNSCNKVDTFTKIINLKPLPTANFVHAPLIPEANVPITFTNKSLNAVSYVWAFGDSTGSTEENPTHMYRKTGTYLVCLTARSAEGCLDTICKRVDAEIIPSVGVPSAFSPNNDGQNDILYVYGAGIETLDFKLYNRWGQLVFETNSLDKGWDGVYKGKPQEMESYGYTLNATFTDGTTQSRQGNVTLLR